MTRFVLVPGAGGVAWYWHRVIPLLDAAGHCAVAVDLPGDDPDAGLAEYADLVVAAVADRPGPVIVVAQSLGAFTAAVVPSLADGRVSGLILVNPMIPRPGETPGSRWGATRAVPAREAAAHRLGYPPEFDPWVYFLHDLPPEIVAASEPHQRAEADAVFASTCAISTWPDVPTRVVVGREDRFFPLEFQLGVARERLGIEPDVLPGGHLIALAQPDALAEYLLRTAAAIQTGAPQVSS